MSALISLRAYYHDFGLQLVQLDKVCLEYYSFVSRTSSDMQIRQEMVSNEHVHQLTVSLEQLQGRMGY